MDKSIFFCILIKLTAAISQTVLIKRFSNFFAMFVHFSLNLYFRFSVLPNYFSVLEFLCCFPESQETMQCNIFNYELISNLALREEYEKNCTQKSILE